MFVRGSIPYGRQGGGTIHHEDAIYHAGGGTRTNKSDTLSIKAGTLDDTSRIVPTCHLWTKSAQGWITLLLEGSVCFDTEPESKETLRAQWRDAHTAND